MHNIHNSKDVEKKYLTINEAAKYLRVSKDTLRRWEKRKIIKPFRSPTGWRYYNKRQLDYVFIQKPDFSEHKEKDKIIINPPQNEENKLKENEILSTLNINLSNRNSKLKNISLIFLFFFLSLNFVLIIFFLYQNLKGI